MGINWADLNIGEEGALLMNGDLPVIAPINKTGIPRIVVPSGIGDIYWIMVKMQAFCRREGIKERPFIVILSGSGGWGDSRIRALPFLKMIPFIQVADPPTTPTDTEISGGHRLRRICAKTGSEFGQSIYRNFFGYEYFINYNGLINTGHWLEKDDDLECDWYFPMTISDEQRQFTSDCIKKYGKYAVFYFSMVGDFVTQNMAQFSLDKMAESINHFINRTGLTPIFVGAWWDLRWPVPNWIDYLPILISKVHGAVNLVGKTTLEEVFGILRGAELISGYHCGLTNMAIVFKRKTVLLWANSRFPVQTSLAVAPPDTRKTTYIPLFTEGLTIDTYTNTMTDLYAKH